ncbi:hypothetical protein [Streptomyces armeniacus]|uniref:hypothetical protein n=1 Tax=Streptomyces armeniacus TaxID=83291 RepID=UPI001AD81EDF|nr:hypothetical protein [Streptomyces armeniacus]
MSARKTIAITKTRRGIAIGKPGKGGHARPAEPARPAQPGCWKPARPIGGC